MTLAVADATRTEIIRQKGPSGDAGPLTEAGESELLRLNRLFEPIPLSDATYQTAFPPSSADSIPIIPVSAKMRTPTKTLSVWKVAPATVIMKPIPAVAA